MGAGTRDGGTREYWSGRDSSRLLAALAIALLVGVLGVDVMRIGFFADDFHFLDVARRIPLLHALTGAYGLHPWYRPLSRELYFELVALAAANGLVLAHALSLVCVGLCAWTLRAIGLRLSGPRVAAIAPVLFLTYAITKFLVAWPSGFQDLLALLLVLLAVRAQMEGSPGRAAILAFLGVFAKETAFVVFPVLALEAALLSPERRGRAWSWWQAAALGVAIAIHVGVRTTWPAGNALPRLQPHFPDTLDALGRVLGGFAGIPVSSAPTAFGLAVLAMVATGLLLVNRLSGTTDGATAAETRGAPGFTGRTIVFLSCAIVLGVSPLVLGHLSTYAHPQEYYAFSAAPWLALVLAIGLSRLPRAAGAVAIVVLAGWNTLAMSYAPVDLSVPDGWKFDRWNWPEAIRLSAKAGRLQEDIRNNLATHPESLVVLLCGMENGSFFQSEDGPSAREALHDPTVRAFWLYQPPFGLRPGKFEILAFNLESRHLERHQLPPDYRYQLAANALAAGRPAAAWALSSYGDSTGNARFEFRYLRMASALIEEGAGAPARDVGTFGLADTACAGPLLPTARDAGFASALRAVLQRPRDSSAHLALANAYLVAGLAVQETIELRVATTLDPELVRERLRMNRLLLVTGEVDAAREDLSRLVLRAAGTPAATEAQWMLAHNPPAAQAGQLNPNPH